MVKQGAGFGEVNSPLHFLQALSAVRRIRCKLHKAKGRTRFGI